MNFEQIASYFVERRKTLGISQKELAELSGVSLHSLSNVEGGRGNPTFDVLEKIAETLGVQISVGVQRI